MLALEIKKMTDHMKKLNKDSGKLTSLFDGVTSGVTDGVTSAMANAKSAFADAFEVQHPKRCSWLHAASILTPHRAYFVLER